MEIMEPFQNNEGSTFIQHLKRGIAELEKDLDNSILVLSGFVWDLLMGSVYLTLLTPLTLSSGPTKPQTPKSEAHSYHELAIHRNLITPATSRLILVEPSALDSYENILYSLIRSYQYTSHWPTHVTVISHAFKERRFADVHMSAMRWPRERFTYVGIDPEGKSPEELQKGERMAYEMWKANPYAGGVGKLGWKRTNWGRWKEMRNPWRVEAPYVVTCPELEPFIQWAGGEDGKTLFPGPLPWDVLA
ncbi:hypothetical protein FGG08_005492 [Glutinoglossum americanum]|uniref:DUF218 domain-containing protein n=1 Tax=Glutinoglossum americanum TaxID=1670608 RepID=A0A9P8I5B6_9PEZI|nr:hypothetical protein FGG08_005492 [Glutinoglossum americanum]